MSTSVKSKIAKAFNDGEIARVFRGNLEDGWADGYVAAIGKDYFALSLIDKSIRFDGFNCFRFKDITTCIVPAPHADFLEAALKKRKDKRPKHEALDLSSLASLILSAAVQFPSLTVHFESEEVRVCHIGKPLTVGDDHMLMLEVTPDGTWETSPQLHDLSQITRVDFGGAYEEALLLVAGRPPGRTPRSG